MMRRFMMLLAVVLFSGLVFGVTTARADDRDPNKVVIDGSTTVGPIAKAFAEYYMSMNKDVNITVSESGSGNGAKSLLNKTCDIADMSRFMKDKEFKAAVENGIMPVAHVVAMDGIAIIVNPANPIKALSVRQVRDIYTGKTTNWKDLGGPNVDIVVISRDNNSGTYETFEMMVMNKQKMAAKTEYVNSNGHAKTRLQKTQAAIAYVGLGFVDDSVKALTVGGVRPTPRTIASGKYPISRPLYMFTDGYPKLGSHVHAFVTLYLTKRGQEIIQAIGFVPVTNYK